MKTDFSGIDWSTVNDNSEDTIGGFPAERILETDRPQVVRYTDFDEKWKRHSTEPAGQA